MARPRVDPEERFWKFVDQGAACHEWQGALNEDGRGRFWDGEKNVLPYQFAWVVAYGPIPEGMCVCHQCDDPKCVRPDHLFLGTRGDNRADCVDKDRQAKGVRMAAAKLTDKQIVEIRHRYAEGGISQRELGALYGVSQYPIKEIVNGRAWRHVKETGEVSAAISTKEVPV